MKILIAGENASARKGGEAILPLKYALMMLERGHDVVLVTHARNREEIDSDYPDLAARTRYIEDARAHRVIWTIGNWFPMGLRDQLFGGIIHVLTARDMRKRVREALAEGGFDVVHKPIPVSPMAPSSLHGLGVPLVIGPMNGGMSYPPGYGKREGLIVRLFLRLGRMSARLANRVWSGKYEAAVLLVANDRTRRALPLRHERVVTLVENAVDLRVWRAPEAAPEVAQRRGFRLVFMGRMIPLKGLDLTLQAMLIVRASRPDLNITLDILGEGPERGWIERRQIPGVHVHGFLSQAECAARLAGADALVLNSLRECGGAVILEAMAMGVPVIASEWGGPADYVTPETGLLVHPSPPASFPRRTADAILHLADNPELARRMGEAGQTLIREKYDWDHLASRMEEIYRSVRA